MRKVLIFLSLMALVAATGAADWNRAGLYGADVRSLVVDPKNPDTVYLGTSQGEVYVSRDGAESWSNPRHGNPFPGYVVDSLNVDRKGRLWAACWGLWGGAVIAVSDDGAVTWKRRDSGLEDFSVRALVVDRKNSDLLLAGGLTGVYRSTDGGDSWEKISDQENVESLGIDPRDPNRIYVGTWRQAFRTEDGGKTWSLVNNGMVLDTDVFSININPKNPDNLWLSTCGWVYSSPDRGSTWTRFKDGFNNRRIQAIDLDANHDSWVYAGSVAGLYRSQDLGKSWQLISDESLVVKAIGLAPARPDRIILGTESDGVYVSHDGGATFGRSSKGLYNVRVAAVVPDPDEKGKLYAAVYFGGSASGLYLSSDRGETWDRLNKTKLPEVLSLIVRSDEPRFVVGTEKGFFFSSDGVDWTQAEPSGSPLRVEKLLAYNKSRLFAATAEGVFTSKDGGLSWYKLGVSADHALDLALGKLGDKRALFALTASGLSIFDGGSWSPVEGAPTRGRTLAVRDDGSVELVVIAGLQGVKSGHIDFDRQWHDATSPDLGFAAVYQTRRGDDGAVVLTSRDRPEMFLSGDEDSWRLLALPVRSTEIVSVAADPFSRGLLFVGTGGQGIFIYHGNLEKEAPADAAAADHFAGGTK
jgi:photosystem II stability/assembly factor-like uncharacterized protein